MKNFTRLFIYGLVMVLVLAFSIAPLAAQEAEPIRIGLAVATTGNIALFGTEQVIGAQLAADYYNANGGINGRSLEIVVQDTGGDEAGAINAFQVLINQENVVGIIGPTLSQQALAAVPEADRAGVPVVGPSNTAPGIPELSAYNVRVSAPVTVVAPNSVKIALEMNPDIQDVVVLFAQNDAFSRSETTVFQQVVTDMGLNLASVQEFQTTDSDFTVQAQNTIAAAPDLVIISGLAADGGTLIRQLRELGYEGLIIGGNGFNTPNIFPVCQALCDGLLVAQAYSNKLESDINTAFTTAYQEQQEKAAGQFPAQAFAAVQVFAESLIALDSEVGLDSFGDLAALRDALNEQILAGSYDTPLGMISFTPDGDIIQNEFYVAEVQMEDDEIGDFVLVATVPLEPEVEMTEPATTPEA